MHSNIFFKFAYDHVGIYNGDDQLAAKAASRELSALNHVAGLCIGRRSIVNGRIVCAPPLIKGLNVPLCITLNYLGFRISASTLLPIGIGTLMLGSEGSSRPCFVGVANRKIDGGKTVVNRDSMCEKLSQQVAKLLNLKIHDVGASSKSQKLWLAGDPCFAVSCYKLLKILCCKRRYRVPQRKGRQVEPRQTKKSEKNKE